MEKGLRDCCRSIRIGKILIKINDETKTPMVKQLLQDSTKYTLIHVLIVIVNSGMLQ